MAVLVSRIRIRFLVLVLEQLIEVNSRDHFLNLDSSTGIRLISRLPIEGSRIDSLHGQLCVE